MDIPCVIFTFNRHDNLQKVLNSLKNQRVRKLIIFIDGARNEDEIKLVDECYEICQKIDWAEKIIHKHKKNRGLLGMPNDMDEVAEKYEKFIIIEDDCLPMPGFYEFMLKSLDYYQENKRVFSISGYQPLHQKYFRKYSFSLMSTWRFMCWGWATWRDRWVTVKSYLPSYKDLYEDSTKIPDIAGEDFPIMLRNCMKEHELNSWAFRVAIITLWLGYVHLLPTDGLIQNIGQDTGVHSLPGTDPLWRVHNCNVTQLLPKNIVWLDEVEPRSYYIKKMKQFVNRANRLPNNYVFRQKLHKFCKSILGD